jgi:hypothetical protein
MVFDFFIRPPCARFLEGRRGPPQENGRMKKSNTIIESAVINHGGLDK